MMDRIGWCASCSQLGARVFIVDCDPSARRVQFDMAGLKSLERMKVGNIVFVFSTGNFNITTLVHVTMLLARNTRHFDTEKDIGWPRGRGRHENRRLHVSEDCFVFPVGHGVFVPASGREE